ncbi:MAG: UvrD-helicase domain-containing protein [Actinomycetota bacterium]|nr:UvrD-helicase domain-containing protein [Actinomycetota bacterium]
MTTVKPFDPAEPIPEGRSVIEASAGTGKTFTIAAQVTRLVAEAGIPIDRILVVTFTRAATAELQGRIRDRLVETLRILSGDAQDTDADDHIRVLLDADDAARDRSIERLTEAVIRFDRAQIYTIHGFAIRLLSHLGFHARISPDLEPIALDTELVSQVVSDLIVARFADDATDLVDANALTDIAKAVTANLDADIVPDPTTTTGEPAVRAEVAVAARSEIDRRLRAGGSAGFDQFLLEARDALADPGIGAHAAQILSERFAVALVDESQDTDPIQWEVINSVFDETRLVIIGDPKQSIYAFRGADIESYLSSVDRAETERTLLTNWRSDGPLIKALDTVFDGVTFGDDRIEYRKVRPAPDHESARMHGPGPALTIRRFGASMPISRRMTGAKAFKTPDTREMVAADVAAGVVRLLHSAIEIDGEHGREHVGPGDVAVLCRTRKQVGLVRAELAKRGVPSVASRSGSVFVTEAADEWRRFLLGVERPDLVSTVRYAATGILVGKDLSAVAALDDDATIELQVEMRRWNELLSTDGISALAADLAHSTGLVERVLRRPDGERLMTDLTHIAEAMNGAWRDHRLGSMLAWIEESIRDAGKERSADEAEARERRLETDAAAVQVQTIHGAKGLEYPIVLCPFLWDGGSTRRPGIPVFHGPESDEPFGRRIIDVGGKEYPELTAHQNLAMAESDAEESRLLYVAMTRARHRLVVWWIDEAADVEKTKLNQILTSGMSDDDDPAHLRWLTDRADGTIEVRTVTEIPDNARYEPPAGTESVLTVAGFDRSLDYEWRRASFTSLSPDHPIAAGRDTDEEPERDDETVDIETEDVSDADLPMPMAALPRGAAFGTLVHHIFENVSFDADDLEHAVRVEVDTAVRRASWNLDVDAMVDGIVGVINTPLGPSDDAVRLRDLSERRTLDEMVFEFPVRTSDGAMNLREIAGVLRDHLPAGDPLRGYADVLDDLPGNRFRGYLTGAIDLTAVIPGAVGHDRYVVMDYKTNTLPTRGEAPAVTDYAHGPMSRVMGDSHYLLQATIYQVALHRYLQWRLPGYDPQNHLGGSAYLFVRGMIGADTPIVDGERCGVFRWNPPPEMIVELSRRFASKGRS